VGDFVGHAQTFGAVKGTDPYEAAELHRNLKQMSAGQSGPVTSEQLLSEQIGEIDKLVNETLTIVGQSADRLFGPRPEPGQASNAIGGGGHVSDRLFELNSTVRRLLSQAQRLNRIG